MTPQERREKIVELLDHWEEFHGFGGSKAGAIGGDPGAMPVLSSMADHVSVVELGRCLALLRAKVPRHYAHLSGHYDAPWKNEWATVKRRNAHGRMIEDVARVRVRLVPAWVQSRLVEHGVDMVSGVWDVRGAGEPELPRPLLAKLRPLADADGWTEAA